MASVIFEFNSLQKLDTLGLKVPCKHSNEIYCTKSSSIISFTLLVKVLRDVSLQMVGILRFVRRWLVIGRVIRQVFPQICGVVFLLLLLLLLFSHTGIMVQCFFSFDLYFCSNILHLKMQSTSFSFSSSQVQWRALGPYGRPVPLCSVC